MFDSDVKFLEIALYDRTPIRNAHARRRNHNAISKNLKSLSDIKF